MYDLLDTRALDIMRSWNLDLMERVLELYTKEDFTYPLWYLHPPIEAEGFVEAISALCDVEHDALMTSAFLESLSEQSDAKKILFDLVNQKRLEEKEKKISNILFHNHLKLLEWTETYMSGVDRFLTLSERREEMYSDPNTLKIYFNHDWKRYYLPRRA